MNFNKHSDLEGLHAFLSPSKYHWINYDEEHLESAYKNFRAVQRGTELHALACDLIRLGVKLPKSQKTLNQYVNDAIGYRMIPEQGLFYSEHAFGTADTISFHDRCLRIHDLKTGRTPVSMHQLEVYAALFCLEYGQKPSQISIELRVYQSDSVIEHHPAPEDIEMIMNKIVLFDKRLESMKLEEQ